MILEDKIKTLNPSRYNKFFWWRRFEQRTMLHKYHPLRNKISNGDYEVSDYYYQIRWEEKLMNDKLIALGSPDEQHEARKLFAERIKRLTTDFERDQEKIDNLMFDDFKITFRLSKDTIERKMLDFDGTLLEFYDSLSTNV
jgi:hypothetical protein